MSTFYNLPALGERTTLLTHFVVREDAQLLYGFGSDTERAAFRELIKITGIGPRMALAVLSGMSVDDLAEAVSQQQAGRLVKVPGIGKKTAERLLLELKGKIGARPGRAGRRGRHQRRPGRHRAGAGRAGLQRQGRGRRDQGAARRHRRERRHPRGAEITGEIDSPSHGFRPVVGRL